MNYWLIVGTIENWKEAFQQSNIWGLRERQRYLWNALQENDVVLFYVMRPVAGVIGYGTVKTKFRQTQPLWSEEVIKNEVIWPWRFMFTVDHCLAPDRWETDRLSSELLRFKAGLSFRQIDPSLAQEIISKFNERPAAEVQESVTHKQIKEKLLEIGKLQNYIAEEEYQFELGRLDVVWRKVERSVPLYVFEVNVKGDFYHDLAKLKHAFDLWHSHIFIVTSQDHLNKIETLLSGSFHEIREKLKFISQERVIELYERKKSFFDLEKELGIF